MKKKIKGNAVYSTDQGRLCPQCHRAVANCACGSNRPSHVGDGIARISRETKGRGGKAVTVINGFPVPPAELKAISKTLKHKCGVGGAIKGEQIEIQGDQRATCKSILEHLGFTCKLAGG